MKKTSFRKLLSALLTLVLLATVFASLTLAVSAEDSPLDSDPVDFGDSFVAALTIPYANIALANVDGNVVATKTDYSDAQLWKFEKVDSTNAYKIISMLDNRCLDVDKAGTDNETNVIVWDDNGLDCQKYYFYSVYDRYSIRPAHCTDKVLDVNAVSFNTQIYDFTITNPNQQIQVEKQDSGEESSEVADESVTDESVADESVADESVVDESVADESVADESVADESKADESKADESKADESKTESKADESKTESKADDTTEKNPLPIIIIVIAVIAVVAVAVVIIIKKKSN